MSLRSLAPLAAFASLAGDDQLARAILKPRVAPLFRQFLIRPDREHAEGNVDTPGCEAGGRNIRRIPDIYH